MKKSTLFLFLFSLALISCSKENKVCLTHPEPSIHHLISLSEIEDFPELLDTLEARAGMLQLTKVERSNMEVYDGQLHSINVRANILYNGLRVFSNEIRFTKNQKNGVTEIYSTNESNNQYIEDLSISLEPTITRKEAIKIAKKEQKFQGNCYTAQLGIYNINANNNLSQDYLLVWKISYQDSDPSVLLNAQTGEIIHSSNGIIEG